MRKFAARTGISFWANFRASRRLRSATNCGDHRGGRKRGQGFQARHARHGRSEYFLRPLPRMPSWPCPALSEPHGDRHSPQWRIRPICRSAGKAGRRVALDARPFMGRVLRAPRLLPAWRGSRRHSARLLGDRDRRGRDRDARGPVGAARGGGQSHPRHPQRGQSQSSPKASARRPRSIRRPAT